MEAAATAAMGAVPVLDATATTEVDIGGFPANVTESLVTALIGQYGPVSSCRLRLSAESASEVVATVGLPAVIATWLVANLNGQVPQGMATPVSVQLSSAASQEGGASPSSPSTVAAALAAAFGVSAATEDNLFVAGLPLGSTEDSVRHTFSQYCTVISVRVLSPQPGRQDVAGLVRTANSDEARWLIANLDGRVPNGLAKPVLIKYAGSQSGVTLEETDWICSSCGNHNFRRRDLCNRCSAPKPGRAGGRAAPPAVQMMELLVKGLPLGISESEFNKVFSNYGKVFSCKVLTPQPGRTTTAGILRMGVADAERLVLNVNGTTPQGMEGKVTIQVTEESKGAGKGSFKGGMMDPATMSLQLADAYESDNLFIKGLPPGLDEAILTQIFSQYGVVTSVKVLPGGGPPNTPMAKPGAGFVRMASKEEAKRCVDLLDGKIPNGMSGPMMVKFAGDGIPLINKIQKKMQDGERVFIGAVKSFDAEKRSGLIACEEVYLQMGVDVYAHQTVLERGHAAPGDLVAFFIHWKGTVPQAAAPMMRIAAEWEDGAKVYALRGWYKGIADPAQQTGLIECAELRLMFQQDVLVPPELACTVSLGWVCFNCKICADEQDASRALVPTCLQLENCHEMWKAETPDFSYTRVAKAIKLGTSEGSVTSFWGCPAGITDKGGDPNRMDPWKALNSMMFNLIGHEWKLASPGGGGNWDEVLQKFWPRALVDPADEEDPLAPNVARAKSKGKKGCKGACGKSGPYDWNGASAGGKPRGKDGARPDAWGKGWGKPAGASVGGDWAKGGVMIAPEWAKGGRAAYGEPGCWSRSGSGAWAQGPAGKGGAFGYS